MASIPDPEFRALHERLVEARTADIPNLVAVRLWQDRLYEYLAECVIEYMEAGRIGAVSPDRPAVRLEVICSEAPALSAPRGFCSPIKSDEIRQFEESVKTVFGEFGVCETAWGNQ